ncbi:hypothetical protein [uncultured Campylobacter sp.]|uniref:hypothetical protein n=1 Tax=uncultured Campylobacter sp. TaxID=218934 RepID=UPI002616688F|nr:hypothetical protein [uncultured Campylobacter sp.]
MSVNYLQDEMVHSARKKGIIYMVLAVLAYFADFIPFTGAIFEFVLKIIAFIFLFLAVRTIAKASGSKTIVRNLLIYIVSVLFGVLILSYKTMFAIGFGIGIFILILGYIFLVISLIFAYLLYKELAKLSSVSLFFISFILLAIGIVFEMIPFISAVSFVFLFLALICEFIAWLKLESINKILN